MEQVPTFVGAYAPQIVILMLAVFDCISTRWAIVRYGPAMEKNLFWRSLIAHPLWLSDLLYMVGVVAIVIFLTWLGRPVVLYAFAIVMLGVAINNTAAMVRIWRAN